MGEVEIGVLVDHKFREINAVLTLWYKRVSHSNLSRIRHDSLSYSCGMLYVPEESLFQLDQCKNLSCHLKEQSRSVCILECRAHLEERHIVRPSFLQMQIMQIISLALVPAVKGGFESHITRWV